MTMLYIIIKMLYTLNIMVQFIFLNAALRNDEYLFFGFQVCFWQIIYEMDFRCCPIWQKGGHGQNLVGVAHASIKL